MGSGQVPLWPGIGVVVGCSTVIFHVSALLGDSLFPDRIRMWRVVAQGKLLGTDSNWKDPQVLLNMTLFIISLILIY